MTKPKIQALIALRMMRGYNFSAGPAILPEELLKEIQAELLEWNGTGASILEIGHRSEDFQALMQTTEYDLRDLLQIPNNYHVLFLGGPARSQFSMIPLNFLSSNDSAGYIVSGIWSKLAYEEAVHISKVFVAASSEATEFLSLPDVSSLRIDKKARYLYYTPNETINGVQFSTIPQIDGVPLFADMTSCLLTEPINITGFDLIFAGAQKNIAPAGLTVLIINENLLSIRENTLPSMLDYRIHAKHKSLYATPPTFNCYVAGKMFRWIKQQGGISTLHQINQQKAAKLYNYIDASDFFRAPVSNDSRSNINVCFSLPSKSLEDNFITFAAKRQLYGLRGHRFVGGLRASLYNAMPIAGVEALIECMQDFANGKRS